jgi:SAM-dependent methyltransferase
VRGLWCCGYVLAVIHTALLSLLACPVDGSRLEQRADRLMCSAGSHEYSKGEHGYFELARPTSPALTIQSTSSEFAHIQESGGKRVYDVYLRPWLKAQGAARVLDAGCGLGVGVVAALNDGFDAVGTDVRSVADLWCQNGRSPDEFTVADVTELPFADAVFDAAMALGVMEHVGTQTGQLTLAMDWRDKRAAFAKELERVVRPGGRILIACPNKRFPIDIQHGPTDELSPAPFRNRLFKRFGVNVHQTWGAYHLVSYSDLYRWYGRQRVRPLPLAGYFGYAALERPGVPRSIGRGARAWVEHMPVRLRGTPLNPYVLAEITV